ncbi:MAG: hypothetical protein DI552_05640 [Brevundimonas sp.]|uniref:ABC-three component system protein n=1 Tax=Brevundimonas sp. TaxID=1871086 RepID=UPI000DBBE108|nr:ABC-three component system protein [Brevundimonas sp.]PZU59674.1 MAG: hypothetical protein DI552_05640 [Brevundimonas sp.]
MEFDQGQRIAVVKVPGNLKGADGGVALCLLQLPASNQAQIDGDAQRPVATATLRHLLAGGDGHERPVLADLASGLQPVVIVAPEYACGHGDWEEIDALVRAANRPIILVVGFGATPAEQVFAWSDGNGETARMLGWNRQTHPLSELRPINGAWCWIHGFGADTACIVLLKNHMEQSTELAQVEWIQGGDHLLKVVFGDVDVFPIICADLVQTLADGPGTAARRVRSHIEAGGTPDRPILITGSLEQAVPSNANWAVAIDTWLNQITLGRPALFAISNVSIDDPAPDETVDRWRSLTGVFGRMTAMPKNQKPLRVSRNIETDNVRGVVVRQSSPYVASGMLKWPPYGPTGDQYYFHAPMGVSVIDQGIPVPVARPPDIPDTELARFLRRYPAQAGWCPCVGDGLQAMGVHLEATGSPAGREFLTSLLNGVSTKALGDPDSMHAPETSVALAQGLHGLATLVSCEQTDWRTGDGEVGQLNLPDQAMNVLVWRDSKLTGPQIRHELGDWAGRGGPHPPLVVVTSGPRTAPDEGVVEPHPRDNIASPPQNAEGLQVAGDLADAAQDVTERRGRRLVACVRLDRVAEVYESSNAAQNADNLTGLIDRLSSAFPETTP